MVRRVGTEAITRTWLAALWGRGGKRLLFRDTVVIGFIVLLSFALISGLSGLRSSAQTVEVEVGAVPVLSVDRWEDGIRDVAGPLGITRIELRGGRARVLTSPCPLKLCLRAGWIGTAGQMLVCVPNEVVVRLTGEQTGGVDAVSR